VPDVAEWAGFELLRDIRELRMTTYLWQRAASHPTMKKEAALRTRCLRGEQGLRPWSWTATDLYSGHKIKSSPVTGKVAEPVFERSQSEIQCMGFIRGTTATGTERTAPSSTRSSH
jgi:hypothetical protein